MFGVHDVGAVHINKFLQGTLAGVQHCIAVSRAW